MKDNGGCQSAWRFRGTAFAAAMILGLVWPAAGRAADPASFSYSPSTPLTGELVTFTSPYTSTQRWDLDGDGTCDDAEGPSAQRTFNISGVYTVKLCVTFGSAGADFTEKVTVSNRPPVAGFNFLPASPFTGDTIVFTSTASDPDGPIMALNWDLDNDGVYDDATGTSASLAFPAAGTYTVRLAALDRDGVGATAEAVVAVAQRPPNLLAFSPVVRITANVGRAGTRVRSLIVTAPKGSRVAVRCRGRGCAVRRLTRSASTPARAARVVRVRRLRRGLLRPGALLTVRITQPHTIGKYTSFRIRRGKPPRRKDRCLLPGSAKPVRCGAPGQAG